jgi:hypothetical protein
MPAKTKSPLIAISKTKGASLGSLRKREVLRMRPIDCASWIGPGLIQISPALNRPDSKGAYENSLASFLEVSLVR